MWVVDRGCKDCGWSLVLDNVKHLSTGFVQDLDSASFTQRRNEIFRLTRLNYCTHCIYILIPHLHHPPPCTTALQLLSCGSQLLVCQKLLE